MESRKESRTERALRSDVVADAFKGFRLWRVVDGKLISQTNDTVWPRDHALAATVNTSRAYWGVGRRGVYYVPMVLFVSFVIVSIVASTTLEGIAESGGAPRWLAGLASNSAVAGVVTGLISACLFWAFSFGYPLLRSYIAKRTGTVVVPGVSTPGIYAMKRLEDVEDDLIFADATEMTVRGSVWLWGDTIEHERGVKGEFAYPDVIMEVSCAGCFEWFPIEQCVDELWTPRHGGCTVSPRWIQRWRPAGITELRVAVPQWFQPIAEVQT